jgi:phosphatidylinositol kinase/protein kinase (PI-3  family)
LTTIEDSNLIVPGQYEPSQDLTQQPFITRINPMVDVINTKQLPRKLHMRSDQGKFLFLLKGNEDLRQDERVMQLITLTNMLLSHDSKAFERQLFIQQYSVIPLSPNSGLLAWLSNTETIMQLISTSRSKIKGNRTSDNELAAMMGLDPKTLRQTHLDFDKLMQKYSVLPMERKLAQYRDALAQSDNNDLKNLLWRRSSSTQTWLSRRTCFARSIATTSMIGYVIGLGDRHPGNTLIEQTKFNAISIDFGDVFEAAHNRTPYPEQVPFRLTPQITNAFEYAAIYGKAAPGTRGHFKSSSVLTMSIMRKQRTSLLAMLEAFAYDPLLDWQAKEVELQTKRRNEDAEEKIESVQPAEKDVNEEKKPVIRPDELQAKFDKQINKVKSLEISLGGSFIVAGSVRNPAIAGPPVLGKITEEREDEVDAPKSVTSETRTPKQATAKNAEGTGGSYCSNNGGGEGDSPNLKETQRRASKADTNTSKNSEGYFARMAGTMTNDRALRVLTVIERKLQGKRERSLCQLIRTDIRRKGRDVAGEVVQSVEDQVQRLIEEATNPENLAQG